MKRQEMLRPEKVKKEILEKLATLKRKYTKVPKEPLFKIRPWCVGGKGEIIKR